MIDTVPRPVLRWHGNLLCEDGRNAGVIRVTVSALRQAKTGEHESHWIAERGRD